MPGSGDVMKVATRDVDDVFIVEAPIQRARSGTHKSCCLASPLTCAEGLLKRK